MSPRVRLSITELTSLSPIELGTCVLEVEEEAGIARERAIAWLTVRDLKELIPNIERILSDPPPEDGFAALINKPNKLLVLASWPWAPSANIRDLLP